MIYRFKNKLLLTKLHKLSNIKKNIKIIIR